MNLETGKVSPQYHIIFDNTFSTVYSDGKFDPDVWESFGCLNLDLHVDATSTIPGDPTIIFPFSSSKEKGGGGIADNNSNNDNSTDNDDDNDATVLLPMIPLPSLPTRGVPASLPAIPIPSLSSQAKGDALPLPSLPL